MGKCDFCDKPMVGYTEQQISLYCEDHEKKAEEILNNFYESLEVVYE